MYAQWPIHHWKNKQRRLPGLLLWPRNCLSIGNWMSTEEPYVAVTDLNGAKLSQCINSLTQCRAHSELSYCWAATSIVRTVNVSVLCSSFRVGRPQIHAIVTSQAMRDKRSHILMLSSVVQNTLLICKADVLKLLKHKKHHGKSNRNKIGGDSLSFMPNHSHLDK